MGSEALREYWPGIFDDVAGRSGSQRHDATRAKAITAPHDPLLPAP
jgi:hypothetical protein